MLTVALLQMVSNGHDQAANRAKGDHYCRRAAALGADIALFPELWNMGFAACAPDAWPDYAIDRDSDFVSHFRELARELDMAIALTFLERAEPQPRNSMSLIDRHGDVVMTYSKVHTCDFGEEAAHLPGAAFHVADLDTRFGAVRVGSMICYDREFPESARILMLKGAELILTPNACTLNELTIAQFRVRAYENVVAVAMTNYAAPQNNGHSVAFDPIAHPVEDGPLRDTLVVEAGEREGIYLAPFDLEAIRRYRQTETLGNAYRKPRSYADLVSHEVADPFVRADARR